MADIDKRYRFSVVLAEKDKTVGWQVKIVVNGKYEWMRPDEAKLLRDKLTKVLRQIREDKA